MFARLGLLAHRWRWAVIAAWAAVTVAGAVFGGSLFDRLTPVDSTDQASESAAADRRATELVSDGEHILAVVQGRDVDDPALVTSISAVVADLTRLTGVTDVDDVYTTGRGEVGPDGLSTIVRVEIAKGLPAAEREALVGRVVDRLHGIDAPSVLVGGQVVAERAFGEQAIHDAIIGESVALVVVAFVLVLILGGLAAASAPLLAAVAAITGSVLGLYLITQVTNVSEYTVNVVTLLGFGLSVDYALLIIYRYREERCTAPLVEALSAATGTAGRAVLIAGLAVGASLGGLALFAEPLLASMAAGGAVVVTAATVCALTLVPALIAVLDKRIPPAGARSWVTGIVAAVRARSPFRGASTPARPVDDSGLLGRLAAYAQRRPGPVALTATVGLLFLAAPFFGVNLGNSDARALPLSVEARQAHDVLQRDFPMTAAAVVTVVVEAPPASAEFRDYLNQLNLLPGVTKMEPRPDVGETAAIVDLTTTGDSAGPEARDVVREVRALDPPFRTLVGGPAAELVDYQDSVTSRLLWVALVVMVSSVVLLFGLTGSLVIPVKALVLNALTLLATLGVLVVVFQWGLGEVVLGFDSWGGVDLTTPLLLFVFVFGLTMDYEVFLLARMKEEWDRHGDNTRAVLAGIQASGHVVTVAATCITIVFLGFMLGGLTAVKEIGVGMAVAVILDVTVVRGLLLPAVMTLLGRWNWWAPERRGRVRVDLESSTRVEVEHLVP